MPSGTIKTYKDDRGFGFIRPDDGSQDLFFHISSLPHGVIPQEGEPVEYEVGADPRTGRPRAENVRLIDE